MKILAGNSNRPLAEAISAYLGVPLTKASVRRFSDMEVFVEVQENVRGEDVFIIQSTSYPANDNLMELLVCMDALRSVLFLPCRHLVCCEKCAPMQEGQCPHCRQNILETVCGIKVL